MPEENRSAAKMGAELDSALESLEERVTRGGPARSGGVVKPPSGAPGRVSLLLSLIALGVAGYATYQVYLGFDRLGGYERELSQVNSQLSEADRRLRGFALAQQGLTSSQEQLSAAIDERIAGLSAEIAARSTTSSQDWIMAEVEYLARLASQRILIEQQTSGAIALLEAADRLIKESEIVSAFPVRQALADDLARLRAVDEVDAEGIYLKLGALARQVDQMPRRNLEFRAAEPARVPEADTLVEAGWREQLSASMARLGSRLASLVDYREGVERVAPILPPEEEYYLRQNLRLRLETAQLALLKGHQAAYEESLAESIHWIETHFDGTNRASVALLAEIDELRREKIARDIPGIAGSLDAIRTYLSATRDAPIASGDPAVETAP